MVTEIDPYAGFCFGVARAIEQAETKLASGSSLRCLGEIVHNQEEMARLRARGLEVIDHETLEGLRDATVLVRAHGEPPETYAIARERNITLVEATCPVVLKLQAKVARAWEEMQALGGTVVIAGKKGHPEVVGLSGQTGHRAVVAESPDDLSHIDFHKPVRLFAQTTIAREVFEGIRDHLRLRMGAAGKGADLRSVNSICGQVSGRVPKLESFCRSHDVIIFVSGRHSSNGRSLFKACLAANPRSYHISAADELDPSWLRGAGSVGISGATSTPNWQMQEIAQIIEQQQTHVPEAD